ncbi:MAG: carboxypeptidase M32 [Candidatus Thermoplasmatota archaeon]|nr:carboxypeptidase M32 [Candidatus Thermoplasmatota archaeon]
MTFSIKESLNFIYNQQKELSVLGGIGALLGWDQMTYMPENGARERSEQTALLSSLAHKRVVSDEFWNHITRLKKETVFSELSTEDQHVVRRLHKDVEKSRKVPEDFVKRSAKITTLAYPAWQKARNKSGFSIFQPHLEKIIDLQKEYCGYIDLPGPHYNILLDDYEEGMTTEKLEKEFFLLKKKITSILDKVVSSKRFEQQQTIPLNFSKSVQQHLCQDIFRQMNLSNECSRIDESTHPFTIGVGNEDVRITTSYERENPLFSFFSTIHEAGHALYELGMPEGKYKDTVIADSPSLGLHESQSRFWENMIARSKPFWTYYYPEFKKHRQAQMEQISLDSWYEQVNKVQPSLIRVEADELTYCLHVILRFELETMLMDEKLLVSELPQVWNEKMDDYLGVTPRTDTEGVLQDMHWSGGSIGYFPTYAIGTIYAAQLFKQLEKDLPETIEEIQQGSFSTILSWLRTQVHQYGRMMTAEEIIKNCCNEGLNADVFVSYLSKKYRTMYE